jgi:hypothetical protein
VALSLGLGNHVDYTYSDQESQQILTAIRQDYRAKVQYLKRPQHPSAEQNTGDRPSQSSQLSQTQQQAQEAAETLKVALVTGHQQRLVNLSTALDKAETRRDEVLERLSDRMAYLQDENLFMNDLLRLTQKKLKGAQEKEPEKQQVTVTAIDALVEAFDAVGNWELPAIAPHTIAGALPM